MQKTTVKITLVAFLQLVTLVATRQARAHEEKTLYPTMAPLDQYLSPDENFEIALARSAAPASISDAADVLVLHRNGYTTAVKGTNGFLCIVERHWAASSDDPDFWDPKARAPICYNPAAARTYVPIVLMKTKLVLAGKSKAEIAAATGSALDKKELPTLEPGAMAYMLSKRQYLGDRDKTWHPHLMFFLPGDKGKTWGGNEPGSPVMEADDPEERATIFFVWVGQWSDGTPAPPSMQ